MELGDGWHPTNRLSPSRLAEEVKHLRALAQKAGRDSDAIISTLRWNAVSTLTDRSGVEEMILKLRAYQEAGVQHVCFDLNIPRPSSLSEMIETMELLMQEVIPRL